MAVEPEWRSGWNIFYGRVLIGVVVKPCSDRSLVMQVFGGCHSTQQQSVPSYIIEAKRTVHSNGHTGVKDALYHFHIGSPRWGAFGTGLLRYEKRIHPAILMDAGPEPLCIDDGEKMDAGCV